MNVGSVVNIFTQLYISMYINLNTVNKVTVIPYKYVQITHHTFLNVKLLHKYYENWNPILKPQTLIYRLIGIYGI